jgi:hypothetical protein
MYGGCSDVERGENEMRAGRIAEMRWEELSLECLLCMIVGVLYHLVKDTWLG